MNTLRLAALAYGVTGAILIIVFTNGIQAGRVLL